MILEKFINKDTMQTTGHLNAFLKFKIIRLYNLYDTLLNTVNKLHTGIIQELSTSQLMMNYQSLEFTMRVTHLFGVTVSNTTGDEKWNQRATDDANYFNYALRKYPLTYETKAGKSQNLVSLRDCYNIAMRDNLVTVTEKSNPLPAESRHGQICTVQGTDIGIPRDSIVIDEVHNDNGCDGDDTYCQCLQPKVLQKGDLPSVLLDATEGEQRQMTKVYDIVSLVCGSAVYSIVHVLQRDSGQSEKAGGRFSQQAFLKMKGSW